MVTITTLNEYHMGEKGNRRRWLLTADQETKGTLATL